MLFQVLLWPSRISLINLFKEKGNKIPSSISLVCSSPIFLFWKEQESDISLRKSDVSFLCALEGSCDSSWGERKGISMPVILEEFLGRMCGKALQDRNSGLSSLRLSMLCSKEKKITWNSKGAKVEKLFLFENPNKFSVWIQSAWFRDVPEIENQTKPKPANSNMHCLDLPCQRSINLGPSFERTLAECLWRSGLSRWNMYGGRSIMLKIIYVFFNVSVCPTEESWILDDGLIVISEMMLSGVAK